ncbi:hypothetical protein VSN93_16560 [Acinetobacter johnsonii]|uniref:hypothetical protein n=1 Tax=Acinetobacter johnsonii TaxID=40214 RepID=UPI0021674947|nr:hypothetical protein [Acinetobacter johnsonii]MCS3526703.1 hypothetical protein [Acinetobacter johnsonii]
MNILNGTEAFEAMMAGRNIMCRAAGELIAFDDLDQFPATVFAKPGYEFCIKIDTIEVAGITFTKPLNDDEVEHGDDIYIVQANGEIHHHKYQVCHEAINQSVARGFAQRDLANAQLQAEAFCKLFDREYRQADIVEFTEMNAPPKQKRGRKAKEKDAEESKPELEAADTASIPVEKKTSDESNDLQVGELKRLQQNAEQLLQTQNSNDEQHQSLLNGLLERAASAQSPAEANALVRYTSEWSEEQRKPLLTVIHNRLNELSASTAGSEEQPPSLMVQIENAKDLTELDCLEIEVYSRHPEIQPKLMGSVKRRRFELENQSSEVAS